MSTENLDRLDGTVFRTPGGTVWVLTTTRERRRALVAVHQPGGGLAGAIINEDEARDAVARMEVIGVVPGTPAARARVTAVADRPRSGPHLLRAATDEAHQ